MGTVIVILLVLFVLLALVAGGLLWFLRRPLPQTQGTIHAPGLERPVEVLRDRWGVPHLYAESEADLFFAQGYVHAQERLWQMELQRRIGSGRLSEILGEMTLEVDRFFRVLGFRRAAQADFEVMDGEARQALEAYSAGVNAFIAARRGRWSVEFSLLRFQPEPWTPVDSLCWAKVMAWNLGCNWASELIRARLAAHLGAERAADLEPPYPADSPVIVSGPGLPPGAEPPPNGWRSAALRDALRLVEGLLAPAETPAAPAHGLPALDQTAGGSNQWVVAGSRSTTGQPLLANDTHMPIQLPATWFQVHLVGGGYHVVGVSLPGTPGVVVGHNEHCAWGLTTAWQDVQDLYVERLNPDNAHQDACQYEFRGEWLDAEVVREEIGVKGRAEPVVQEVVVTRHGPILSPVIGEQTPLALRWVALEPSRRGILDSVLGYNRARNWAEFRAALADWSAPPHNFVYADVEGNIGFLQAGWVPVRAQGYGLAPAPGWSGEYEWTGYLSLDELPQAYNPASGWLGTANHQVVDADYPHFLSGDWENPCRARRLADLLAQQATLSADDFARFQLDTYSAQAERFVRHLLTIEPSAEDERHALEILRTWDAHLEPDSVAASLYQVTRLRALHVTFDGHVGATGRSPLLAAEYVGLDTTTPLGGASPYHGRSIVRLLDLLDDRVEATGWSPLQDPASGEMRSQQAILHQALRQALDQLAAEYGPDLSRWTWGRLNRVHFAHPVGSVKPLHLIFNRGPYPLGGDQDTLLRAAGKPQFPFEPAAVCDALRFIADLSDWEQCRIVVPGGQSGHVASRHYADGIPLWREGRLRPMPFARDQVKRVAAAKLSLLPQT
jgi:penicillin amidase